MIQTSPSPRILVAVEAVDFRRGVDDLAVICRKQLERDPMNGWTFVSPFPCRSFGEGLPEEGMKE